MSLTRFITDKDFQELRDKFKSVFPRPTFKIQGELLAPPLTSNYSIVGQAFDYLLRFYLERNHKHKINGRIAWVADSSYKLITKEIQANKSKVFYVGFRRDVPKDRIVFSKMLAKEYAEAKSNYLAYLNDGRLTEDVVRSTLYLARLDVYFRSGMIDPNLGNESKEDIADVFRLMEILNSEHFHVRSRCFVNPTFGEGSGLVGGADADLIIDDTLIEIKVTKNLKLERDHLNQTIGYCILSMIGGINGNKRAKPIKNIAVYFARHGIFWKIPLSEMANEQAIVDFKEWFLDYANRNIWGRFTELEDMVLQKADVKKKLKANSSKKRKVSVKGKVRVKENKKKIKKK